MFKYLYNIDQVFIPKNPIVIRENTDAIIKQTVSVQRLPRTCAPHQPSKLAGNSVIPIKKKFKNSFPLIFEMLYNNP